MAITKKRHDPLVNHDRIHRFTVSEYHKLFREGILTADEKLELIEGHIVYKWPQNPPHSVALTRTRKSLKKMLPTGWDTRLQVAITLTSSELEPDITVVRGYDDDYETEHPVPEIIGMIVEVADSSLEVDQTDKQRIYARDGLPIYWIVNLPERRVEIYTEPQPTADPPCYDTRTDYGIGTSVPFVLEGATVGQISVDEILP